MSARRDRILVVDDNPANLDMMVRRLARCGFDIATAAGGAECLARIAEESYDLILLDIMMPGISGMQVLEEIRKDFSPSSLPVIMVTAQRGRDSVLAAMEAGANDHITKPIDFPVLIARVESQLERKRAKSQLEDLNKELEARVAERTKELTESNAALRGEISERERAQQALMRNQERTNAILNFTLNTIVVTDMDRHIEFINRAGETTFGVSLIKLYGADLNDHFVGNLPGAKSTSEPAEEQLTRGLNFEAMARRADGSEFPTDVSLRMMQSDEGAKLLFVITDATERKRAEQQIRHNELQYRALIERFPIPLFVHIGGNVVFANDGAAELAGYERASQIIGMNAMRTVHPDDRDKIARMHSEATKHHAPVRFVVHRNIKTDGTVYWCESAVMPIDWDGKEATIVAASDISERKEIEDRFRLLAKHSSDLITWRNLSGRFVYVSPSVEALLGYTPEEVLDPKFPPFIHPDDSEFTFSVYKDSVLAGSESRLVMRRLRTKTGDYKWFESLLQPVIDDNGNVTSIVTASRDISERKAAEEEREALQGQLRQSQKIESLGTLAGGIAHEFNNLLMVIGGFVRRAIQNRDDPAKVEESLEKAQSATTRAASITKQLLVFSRKHVQERKKTDISRLLDETKNMLVPLIGENIDLQLDIKEETMLAEIDPDQFVQAVVNLTINARDAMPQGGWLTLGETIVEIAEEKKIVLGQTAKPGRYVGVYVEDQGTGIPDDILEKIFDPFYSTKGPTAGTGLGLAVVYGFVRESGGFIDIRTAVGEGTRFTLCFPAVEGEAAAQTVLNGEIPRGNGEILLVVEDEEELRSLVVGDLEGLGYKVLEAGDGIEAMEVEDDFGEPIDLLVSDVMMPGFSGPETAAALSASQPDMKVIFMSGYAPQDDKGRTTIPKDTPFVSKPVDLATLATKVREVLDGR